MQNALPDVEGFEKNEKLDIALRPEQVRISRMMSAVSICNKLSVFSEAPSFSEFHVNILQPIDPW